MREVFSLAAAFMICLSAMSFSAAAVVETTSYATADTNVYQWADLEFSGVLEPDINTIGRVCSVDCAEGKKDPYDLWLINVSHGSSFDLQFESLHDPDWANIDVDFCYSNDAGHLWGGELTCRDWFDTDELEEDSSNPPKRSNVFGTIYLYASSVDGWSGDDSRYSMRLTQLSVGINEPNHIDSIEFGLMSTPLAGTVSYFDEVCWNDCFIHDEMDIYSFDLVEGDDVEITVKGTYSSWPQEYDRGFVSFWAMSESSLWDANEYTVFTLNEQDSKTVVGTATSTQKYFIKIYSNRDSNEGDNFGYQLVISINAYNRNHDVDFDLDGYSDHQEFVCDGLWNSRSSYPADLDSDYVCDSLDSDIDGDGVENPFDLFPSNPLEHSDFDGDGEGDNADIDDDNDGWWDTEEEWLCNPTSDPKNSSSVPNDLDGDKICDSMDDDSDNDGYADDIEEQFGTDPNNSSDFPPDMDGDTIPDEMDSDRDGDGWSNTAEIDCGTDDFSSNSYPPDLDGDYICDILDLDRDGDGWSNSEELFITNNPT